jgi:hypothetical protein
MRQTSRSGCDKVDDILDLRGVSMRNLFVARSKDYFEKEPSGLASVSGVS